jgi:hypothetical protein
MGGFANPPGRIHASDAAAYDRNVKVCRILN